MILVVALASALVLVGLRALVRDVRAVISDDMRDALLRREWSRHKRTIERSDPSTRTGRNRIEAARRAMARIERDRDLGNP